MYPLLVFILLISTTLPVSGQEARFTASERQKQMQKLTWMMGQWQGSGWIDRGKDGRCEISYSQTVHAKENHLLVVIDGGALRTDTSAIECSVRRLLSYPPGDEYIRWEEFSSVEGTKRMNEAHVKDQTIQVGFPPLKEEETRVGAGTFRKDLAISVEGRVRITISLNDRDEWIETWEMRRQANDGPEWFTFFKVALNRQRP